MTKTYAQLMKQVEALTREAQTVRRKEIEGVVARIKEAIDVYGISAADLGLGIVKRGTAAKAPAGKRAAAKRPRAAKAAVAKPAAVAKFRNEAGQEWAGRGPRPKWLREALAAGKSLSDFKV